MPDYAALCAEWDGILASRRSMGSALALWTAVLQGWRDWDDRTVTPLGWTVEECRQRWEREVPLLADAAPSIAPESIEHLLGPLMQRLAVVNGTAAAALSRFAAAWDEGLASPASLYPSSGKGGVLSLQDELDMPAYLTGFLAHAGLRPALDAWFSRMRTLPEGVWDRGCCPWCGGMPSCGDLMEDGKMQLFCHLCGGAWPAARLRCPFCDARQAKDMVPLVARGAEQGYFVWTCRVCRGYLKGLDRRERWNAASPLVEDWASPHLDWYAVRAGYHRPTPSLAQLLPEASEGSPA